MKKNFSPVLLAILIIQILFVFRNSIPILMDTASHEPVTAPQVTVPPSNPDPAAPAKKMDKNFSALDSSLRYAALSSKQKKIYKAMQKAVAQHSTFVGIDQEFIEEKEFLEVLDVFWYTDPTLLAAGGLKNERIYQITSQNRVLSVKLQYALNKKTIKKYVKSTRKQVKKIVRETDGMNDWDKAKYFHDYLILHATYSTMLAEKANHSAYNCLVSGYCVCDGYAKAYKLLCDKAQIPCEIVTGKVDGVGHAWNLVQINGVWYHMDVTFDDPVGMPEDYIDYQYFCLTTEEILRDHVIDPEANFPMP